MGDPVTRVRPPQHVVPHDPVPADRPPLVMPPDPLPPPRPPQPPPPDPVPRPNPVPVDPPPPPPPPVADPLPSPKHGKLAVIDQWRDTSVRGARRSEDMPLFAPPQVSLEARRVGPAVQVRLLGGEDAMSIRWEGVEGTTLETREVSWTPTGPFDQLRVAVRTRGGVAITSLRARMV